MPTVAQGLRVEKSCRENTLVPSLPSGITETRMSAIDEIIGYKQNPDEDFYGMLNCSEHSTVSCAKIRILAHIY